MNGRATPNGSASPGPLHALLPVTLVARKDNFVTIPQTFANKLSAIHGQDHAGIKALRLGWYAPAESSAEGKDIDEDKLEPQGCEAFVGWAGATTTKHHIELPVDLAEALGVKHAVDYTLETTPGRSLLVSVSLTFAPGKFDASR